MKSALIKIGNSQGVRIPKILLEEAGISGPVDLRAEHGRIVVERGDNPREGWEEAFEKADTDDPESFSSAISPTSLTRKSGPGDCAAALRGSPR